MINKTFKIYLLSLSILLTLSIGAKAQLPFKIPGGLLTTADTAKKDTILPKPARTDIKPYSSIIKKGTQTKKGLFTVHQLKEQIYFEIPDSILGRDIMVINRLSRGPAGYGIYAGEELDNNTRTIRFEMGPDSSIRVRDVLLITEADSADQINKAVLKSSIAPILISFPIKAFGPNKHSYVIETTKFIKEKSFINFIDPGSKLGKSVSAPTLKDMYLEAFDAYPMNVELTISKTMESKLTGMPPGTLATIEVRSSFIALPKIPMQRRYKDPRVGYFADSYRAFGDAQQKSEYRELILKWRMEPKPEDVERYKKGELVEPAKPIVIYIDPATPKQWRAPLIQGINDWQKAFEQAGFKNAIIGKEWPENDPGMNMDDARYSLVRYLPSEISNAYGPNIHDPRSGEIIQTNIGWYHNVMSLLHNWYLVQAGAVDPEARKAKFSDELMGKLIRFVSSHEIGHTLGLRHNFLASSQTPVDSLRNSGYLKSHGHTSSIMDYARFNYVAQPEDHIAQAELFPRIGDYDTWAIEWGYKNLYTGSAENDRKVLSEMVKQRVKPGSRLYWTEGEIRKIDPRSQTEDLGDNAMKASIYGIKNLKRIMPNLLKWSAEENDLRDNLYNSYNSVLQQYTRYINHVLNNVGGSYYDTQTNDNSTDTYTPVPKSRQKEALAFFGTEVFNTPYWLLDNSKKIYQHHPEAVENIQIRVLNSLLDKDLLEKQRLNEIAYGAKAYPLNEYLGDVHQLIWKELKTAKTQISIDRYHRNLQKTYLGNMLDMFVAKDPEYTDTDVHSIVNMELIKLDREIAIALKKQMGTMEKYHLLDMKARIKAATNPKI